MPESDIDDTKKAIGTLKNNRSGNLKLKNGRLAVDTGTNTYYTTIIGSENFGNEAVAGDDQQELKRAKNATNHTGDIYVQNGTLYATGYGRITLED